MRVYHCLHVFVLGHGRPSAAACLSAPVGIPISRKSENSVLPIANDTARHKRSRVDRTFAPRGVERQGSHSLSSL